MFRKCKKANCRRDGINNDFCYVCKQIRVLKCPKCNLFLGSVHPCKQGCEIQCKPCRRKSFCPELLKVGINIKCQGDIRKETFFKKKIKVNIYKYYSTY